MPATSNHLIATLGKDVSRQTSTLLQKPNKYEKYMAQSARPSVPLHLEKWERIKDNSFFSPWLSPPPSRGLLVSSLNSPPHLTYMIHQLILPPVRCPFSSCPFLLVLLKIIIHTCSLASVYIQFLSISFCVIQYTYFKTIKYNK